MAKEHAEKEGTCCSFFFITKGILMLLDFHFNEESSLGSAISDLKAIPVLG